MTIQVDYSGVQVPLTQELKDRWVAALESGTYLRGTGQLAYPDQTNWGKTYHCCLGVLREIEPQIASRVGGDNAYLLPDEPDEYDAPTTYLGLPQEWQTELGKLNDSVAPVEWDESTGEQIEVDRSYACVLDTIRDLEVAG
jgi:hypothetical protein